MSTAKDEIKLQAKIGEAADVQHEAEKANAETARGQQSGGAGSVGGLTPSGALMIVERRQNRVRDRRALNRMAHPELAIVLARIDQLCRVWIGFSAAFLVVLIGSHFIGGSTAAASTGDPLVLSKFWIFAIGALGFTVATQRFRSAIEAYLTSESQEKLLMVAKRGAVLVIGSMGAGLLLAAAQLFTVF